MGGPYKPWTLNPNVCSWTIWDEKTTGDSETRNWMQVREMMVGGGKRRVCPRACATAPLLQVRGVMVGLMVGG